MAKKLEEYIRTVPDFPQKGILFRDITTLLKDPLGFREAVDQFYERYREEKTDKIVGLESRGFILAPVLAYKMGKGFVPARKSGKLPAEKIAATYMLEYGKDSIEMHRDAIEEGDRVLIIDDLLATGGTASACIELVEKLKGTVAGLGFLIELTELEGWRKIEGYELFSLIKY